MLEFAANTEQISNSSRLDQQQQQQHQHQNQSNQRLLQSQVQLPLSPPLDNQDLDSLKQQNQSDQNQTSASIVSENYHFWKTEQLAVAWIILITIVIGNSSILYKLKFSQRRKSNINHFIIHLAFADLLVGLVSVSTDIAWRYSVGFYIGLYACKSIKFLQVLVTYSSTYLLVALSVDRWEAVARPLIFARKQRHGRYLVGGAWLSAAILAIPTGYVFEIKRIEKHDQCWVAFNDNYHWQIYIVFHFIVLFVLPALIITACYVWIVYVIWRKAPGSSTSSSSSSSNNCGTNKKKKKKKKKQQHHTTAHYQHYVQPIQSSSQTQPHLQLVGHLQDNVTDATKDKQQQQKDNLEQDKDYFAIKCMDTRKNQLAGRSRSIESTSHWINKKAYNQRAIEKKILKRKDTADTTSIDLQLFSNLTAAGNNQLTDDQNNNDDNSYNYKSGKQDLEDRSTRQHGSGVIPKARIKTVKMTLVIVFAFIVCWLPYMVCSIGQVFGYIRKDTPSLQAITTFIQSLVHLNSAVNPMIFWIFSGDCASIGATLSRWLNCFLVLIHVRSSPPPPPPNNTSHCCCCCLIIQQLFQRKQHNNNHQSSARSSATNNVVVVAASANATAKNTLSCPANKLAPLEDMDTEFSAID